MNYLFLAWKDVTHPQSGGAELITHEVMSRLVRDGHTVTLFTASYPDAAPEVTHAAGYRIIRSGGRYTNWLHAMKHFWRTPKGTYGVVIDQMNTAPYFAQRYFKDPVMLFTHQLAREIWFYEARFPLNHIGYNILEPVALWLLRRSNVITVSESTKNDLISYGFLADRINIISEGINTTPASSLDTIEKYTTPTLLSLGAIRPMKQTNEIIKVFEKTKKYIGDLRLIIAGDDSGEFADQVKVLAENSPYSNDIQVLGRVSREMRDELMQRSHMIVVTSIREGWGLIVTEANSQGTPAAVYGAPGLRDSVRDNETGIVAAPGDATKLGQAIATLLQDPDRYNQLQLAGWQWSKEITFEQCYSDFTQAVNQLL